MNLIKQARDENAATCDVTPNINFFVLSVAGMASSGSPFYGSQPPAYDAAITSVQPNCQQPVMMVSHLPIISSLRYIWSMTRSRSKVQAPPIFTPPVEGMQHPNHNGPADFFVLVLITTIACGFLNLTSLIFGTIALVMAVMVRTHRLFRFLSLFWSHVLNDME